MICFFFFFKQKTAYEMRISDWSSDVCSSDLAWLAELGNPYRRIGADPGRAAVEWGVTGVPETFIIDGNGRIRWHHRGPLVPEIIERDVKPLLAALGLCGRCSLCCLCCCLPRRRLRCTRAVSSTNRCWHSQHALSPPSAGSSSARTTTSIPPP